LAELYRDNWTLRQVWVRIQALPYESPLHAALREAEKQAEAARASAALDDVHNRYAPKG